MRRNPENAVRSALTRKCGHCGARFSPVNDQHHFCSDICRLQGWIVHKAAEIAGQSDLFAEPADDTEGLEIGLAKRDRAVGRAGDLLDRLVPIAVELAQRAGEHGITVSDVRLAAEKRGVELPKNLSALGGLMRKAGLQPRVGHVRRSEVKSRHGGYQQVWRLNDG